LGSLMSSHAPELSQNNLQSILVLGAATWMP
jgi:hypothetical protein